ncbi:MAG: hypothetical protein PHX13_04425 [Thiovulaceae bacterium]|nr:hypothetical protein [Sulfurimonadaceae bacterium]
MKQILKKIPFVGVLLRWFYNLSRLNSLKHRVYIQEQQIALLIQSVNNLQNELSQTRDELNQTKNELSAAVTSEVAKEILYQSLSFQQRIDQFIFDMKIDTNIKL